MVDPTSEVLQGAVGFFWPQADRGARLKDDEESRGYVHLNAEGYVEVKVLEEGPVAGFLAPPTDNPKAIFGMTEVTGILVPEVLGQGTSRNIGGSRASVRTFVAEAVVAGVKLGRVRGSSVGEVAAYFPEGLSWSGQNAIETSREVDKQGLLRSVTMKLTSDEEEDAGGKVGSIGIGLRPHWETTPEGATGASQIVSTALEVRLFARRPRPLSDFATHLLCVQDLLSMAHDRFVVSTGGRASPAGDDDRSDRPYLWHQRLMQNPPHQRMTKRKASGSPLFTLDDIGGAPGVRRWLKLCHDFPDAASAVSTVYRRGGYPLGLRLQEVAAAIESYVSAIRRGRSAKWAAKSAVSKTHAASLARRVGAPFEGLVGDIDKWADRFQQVYNGTKHNTGYHRDPRELKLMSWSGGLLLAAALLDRAAGSKKPSRSVLQHHRIRPGGESLRKLLAP